MGGSLNCAPPALGLPSSFHVQGREAAIRPRGVVKSLKAGASLDPRPLHVENIFRQERKFFMALFSRTFFVLQGIAVFRFSRSLPS